MLDVRRMRVLREVATRGSFSAAAQALSFTQSAVSQHVAALEREAGQVLVERGPRGVRLTEAGEALVSHADAILARLEDAEQELAAIAGLCGGRLRLGSFPSAGATLVPRAVARFSGRHADVDLSMVEGEPNHLTPRLDRGELDLALLYAPAGDLDQADGLERVDLLDDVMDVVLPRDHKLAGRSTVRLADLACESFISGTAADGTGSAISCHGMLARACNEAGFEPRVSFRTDDYQAAQAFVAAGVGVTLLPRLALTTQHPLVEVRSLGRDAPVRRVSAATVAGGYRSPATLAMLDVLTEVSSEFRADEIELSAAS